MRRAADLSGTHLVLAPVASATRIEATWQGSFGGELSLLRIRDGSRLAALGITAGGARFASRDGGILWSNLLIGTQVSPSVGVGACVGPIVQLDVFEPPRYGVQGTVWLWAGVMPFIRVGTLQESGTFVDLGFAITLPTKRW